MLSFWITLFVSTEMGIAVAVGFSIIYAMLRAVFPKVRTFSASSGRVCSSLFGAATSGESVVVPSDAMLISFTDSIFFPNALRVKKAILEAVQGRYDADVSVDGSSPDSSERSWSVASQKRIEHLRRRDRVMPSETRLDVMVWDFSSVPFMDVTGVMALWELKDEIRKHVGERLKLRFVGMNGKVRRKLQRASWAMVNEEDEAQARGLGADVVYSSLDVALRTCGRESSVDSGADYEKAYYRQVDLSASEPASPV
jgi:sodium-independent sulfate anion transporter 11